MPQKDADVELLDIDQLYACADYITLHLALKPETWQADQRRVYRQDERRRCASSTAPAAELIDTKALTTRWRPAKWPGPRLTYSRLSLRSNRRCSLGENVVATPHIGGSTAEAQEKVGIRIAKQVRDFLKDGVVLSAVNMPSVSAEQ